MINLSLSKSEIAIKYVSKLMTPIVAWLIKSGVGYKDFSPVLKRIFFQQALIEAEKTNSKMTDSALSLLAGLNRRDISAYKEIDIEEVEPHFISISARVVTLWIQKKWDRRIAFCNQEVSFESLCKEISQDTHPKTVLLDLQRLGLVDSINDTVILNAESFTPSQSSANCQALLADSVSDHLNAGIHNIFINPNAYLEQCIKADELSPESVQQLKEYSIQLWIELSEQLLARAQHYSENDKHKTNANCIFTFGVYQFDKEK